ncbi:FAD dependent oxidoreductase [Hypoxylon sp. NC0597]|nr:FAD dependent oxidoreductase [Hypoxylon sp. NC0597]
MKMFTRTARRQLQSGGVTCLARSFSSTAPARADFTHVVIGGGAVGLAIARALASHQASSPSSSSSSSSTSTSTSTSTLLLERHSQVGTETSSRNSEVIHAGLYYGPSSLKTRLCIAGRQALYTFCDRHGVPHRRTGKWVVAQDASQRETLERIHRLCSDEIGVPTRWVGADEAREREPAVRADAGVLESPETGIVDSHALMAALLGLFEDAGGVTALNSDVVGVEPLHAPTTPTSTSTSTSTPTSASSSATATATARPGSRGWALTVRDSSTGEESRITTDVLINSAGLGAAAIHNLIVPRERQIRLYYAKGNYFSYGASSPKVSRLIYPVTAPGAGGLGTHLTLDLAGRMRFGPDVEWVDSPSDLAVNAARLPAAVAEIKKYLPTIDESALSPDYAGVRPKLRPAGAVGVGGSGFVDFHIREEDGYEGWVNLLGIESPGLTSCLAIGDLVRDMLYGSGRVEGSAPLGGEVR